MTEICNICGKSVEWGSGKYVNRFQILTKKLHDLTWEDDSLKEILFALNAM
jgi:hypothetical protein